MLKTVMPRLLSLLLAATAAFAAAPPKPIVPAGVKPVGPYTPGLLASDLLYVSGQGARDAQGQMPPNFEAQVRQCLENVKAIVTAAGLTMDHVVYAQGYLSDMKSQYDTYNKVYARYFPKNPPARSTIGVAKMPTDTPVEITVIAVRDLKMKKVVQYPGRKMPVPLSPAVVVGDRAYVAGGLGRVFETGEVPKDPREQVKIVMDSTETILKAAGMELRHMVFANIYVTPDMPFKALAEALEDYIPDETAKAIIQTTALPFGARIEISGVASRNLRRWGNCTGVDEETMYCAARAGTTRQALESIKNDLAANGADLTRALSTNVYMDNIQEFVEMNKIYATYFGQVPPTRTTIQPSAQPVELSLPPATGVQTDDKSPRVQISVVVQRDAPAPGRRPAAKKKASR